MAAGPAADPAAMIKRAKEVNVSECLLWSQEDCGI